MISFSDLTKQVHLLNDLILTDMVYDDKANTEDKAEEPSTFSRHLLATKNWFSRISWANKKRFVLALLHDVHSAWALSLVLKSIWNCRPKDAVLSFSEKTAWSSYDEVPFDHNRTALPSTTLAQVMKSDRIWFLSLEPEVQAMVLSELLTVAGGPVMWTVLRRAQVLYERYRDRQMQNLLKCIAVDKTLGNEKGTMKETSATGATETGPKQYLGEAHKEMEANLEAWNAIIKSMKDNLKLEEIEMTFSDGTSRKIWKVNRPKPEAVETVDFVQLLPSAIGKRIMSYLPRAQLGDYARVNRYWAFLIDEFRAELTARQKIDIDFTKMHDEMLHHDISLDLIEQIDVPNGAPPYSSQGKTSLATSLKAKPPPSTKASERSAGADSMRHFLSENLNKPKALQIQKPLRNLAELSERLHHRGAADENLWTWCDNVLKHAKNKTFKKSNYQEGVLTLGNVHFPCPLMKQCLKIPLCPPLFKDPAMVAPLNPKKNVSAATVLQAPRIQDVKRYYSLWARNFSGLYHVCKIPSHQSPV